MGSRATKRWAVAAVALVAAGAALGSVAAVAVQGDPSTGVSRIERAVGKPWRAYFSGPATARSGANASPVCVGAIPFETSFQTPVERDRIDLTVTATVEYRTSPRDGVWLEARIHEEREGGEAIRLKPREYRLAPSARRTSATVVWIQNGVPAAGRRYSLSLLAEAECRIVGRSFARGNRTTVVIESWSAGD